ncbi:MAG: hypothetical protein WBN77_12255 [Desulfobacterales bacterium]
MQSDEERKKQFFSIENRKTAINYIITVCKDKNVDIKTLKAGRRRRKISKIRAQLIEKLLIVDYVRN